MKRSFFKKISEKFQKKQTLTIRRDVYEALDRAGAVSVFAKQDGMAAAWNVFSCVDKAADAVSHLPVVHVRNGSTVENSAEMRRLQSPNSYQSWDDFIYTLVANLIVSGNAFVKADVIGSSLWAVPSKNVTIKTSNDYAAPIAGYRYLNREWPVDLVGHIILPNPDCPGVGMSKLEPLRNIVLSQMQAQAWNASIMNNDAKPPYAILMEQGTSLEQAHALRDSLRENNAQPHNAHAPLILPNVRIEKLGFNASDMDWLAGLKANTLAICSVLGVPPEIIGDADHKTYSNYKEARKAFYQETVLPLAKRVLSIVSDMVFSKGSSDRIIVDVSAVDALASDFDERLKSLVNAWWLTANEKRAESNYEPMGDDNADKLFIPANMTALEEATMPQDVRVP